MKSAAKNFCFSTIVERDAFIEANYPTRKCLSGPGTYSVPGGILVVFLREVSFVPRTRAQK